jgi:hypothetical protein
MTSHSQIPRLLFLTLCWVGMSMACLAQLDTSSRMYSFNHAYSRKDSNNIVLYFAHRTGCKSFTYDSISFPDPRMQDVVLLKETVRRPAARQPVPLLQLHGNIAYSFDYRSQVDTPFAGSNLQQHNEQVYVDATLKGKYPFRIVLDSRQSNSPFFRNYTDVNIEFKHQAYQQSVKQAMIAEMTQKMRAADSLNKYEQQLSGQKSKYLALTSWIGDPARRQEIVQEKEQLYRQALTLGTAEDSLRARMGGKDSLSGIAGRKDSLLALMRQPGAIERQIAARKKEADSLYKAMAGTQSQSDSARAKEDSTIRALTAQIRSARSIGELEEIGKKAGTSPLSGTDKTLLGVTHFGIGRNSVNYSELTVNNVSLTGVNVEYNPSFYAAFAAGSVDYLFRDFIVQPGAVPKQNLVLGRFGWGDKERRVFILTVYTGTKNSFGGSSTSTVPPNPAVSSMAILGYSLEAKYRLDANKDFSFEAAKSSSPYAPGINRTKSFGQAFAFSDRNNEAFSAKFNLAIPATRSTLNLFYKEIGANFQSYSVFNSGSRQVGWGGKWHQYLFKDQLSVTLQVKKSTFDDPLLASAYSSSLLFKSLQLVYRKKKWPVFSVGYMPSTQLIKDSAGTLSENVYYALTGTVFYTYTFKRLRMNSSLMYNQFFNRGTDSGFVLYNARNILYAHQVFWPKINTQTELQYTVQPGLVYWMFQHGLNVTIGKYVSVGGSLKNDLLPGSGTNYWGNSLQAQVTFKKVGSLRMQYSKDYLPNGTSGLVPYNWGRVNWVKVF